ncbi:YDG domain-containing protein [Treponema primitia]|uniref:YDG domain-containing protein n=1 Tax=Treponema primitia TaxID=88058 RepID=UPI0002555187|nr:YDG domain-containing protein [Treponema primitia]
MNKHNMVTISISILKKVTRPWSAVTFLALMALGGCMNPLSERSSSGGGFTDTVPDGYGRVTVSLAGAGARTLYPAAEDFGAIILSFQGPVGAAIPKPMPVIDGSASVDLALGAWTITATAYTKATSTVAAAWGSAKTTIGAGENPALGITLSPYTGDNAAKGTLRYAISIGAIDQTKLDSAKITVTKTNGDDPDVTAGTGALTWDKDAGGKGKYAGTVDLDAGYYLVQVKLTRGGLSATRSWVAHLYPGLETLATYDFSEADLKPALMGTVSLDGLPIYGEELTAVTTDLEAGPGDLSYVWKRGDIAAGEEAEIDDENAATYTLTAADVDKHIVVEVSRAGYDGNKRADIGPVARRLLTVKKAEAMDRFYDGSETVTVTIKAGNVVGDDEVSITAEGAVDSANAGADKKNVTISNIVLIGDDADNYAAPVSITGVEVTISKAPITPVVEVESFTAPGEPDPQLESGNLGSGGVSYTYATAEDGEYDRKAPEKAGTYWVKAAVAETTNYQGAESEAVSFTIHPAGKPITAWMENHAIVTDAPNTVILSRAGDSGKAKALFVTVKDSEKADSYQWSIGGVVQEEETDSSFAFDSADWDIGKYRLTLQVVKGGVPYSTIISITVGN